MCEHSSYPYSESFLEMMSTRARDVNWTIDSDTSTIHIELGPKFPMQYTYWTITSKNKSEKTLQAMEKF